MKDGHFSELIIIISQRDTGTRVVKLSQNLIVFIRVSLKELPTNS
jgi:hypothetical protein